MHGFDMEFVFFRQNNISREFIKTKYHSGDFLVPALHGDDADFDVGGGSSNHLEIKPNE